MSRVPPQVNLQIDWKVAQAELSRILSVHARVINEKLDGADEGETGSATASFTATNKPGANNKTSPDTWVEINLNGKTYYLPAFLP
jgi:hypothetical protein